MRTTIPKSRAFIFVFLLSPGLFAQPSGSKYELGIHAGSFIYQGDLTPSAIGSFKTPSLAFGIHGSRKLFGNLSVRADLNVGWLKGNDAAWSHPAWRQQRNFNFKSTVTEITAMLVWNPLHQDQRLSPYLFGGLGYSFHAIHRDYSGFNAEYFITEGLNERLDADVAHNLPRTLPIIPFGVGLRYPLTRSLSVNTEAGYRYVRTDYLDGFSQAGNPRRDDHYYMFTAGITYSLAGNNNLRCPVIRF